MILMAFFCCMNILLMFVCEVQVYILMQYSRCERKKLVYSDFLELRSECVFYTVYEEDGARELADKCICVSIEV